MNKFGKTLTTIAAAATLAIAAVAAPQPAQARDGGAIAAGIIGGLAVGAIIGSAAARGGPSYYGEPRRHYYRPAPVYYRSHCWWRRERIWDGYGWYHRRVRVCD
jgi:hypothetical protein